MRSFLERALALLLLGMMAWAGSMLGADSHLSGSSDPPGEGEALVSSGGAQINVEFEDCSTFVGFWDPADQHYESTSGEWMEFDYVTASAGRYSSSASGNGSFQHN